MTLLFLALSAVAPGQSNGLSEAGEEAVPEVRVLCLAPSPYTQRHDALRTGLSSMSRRNV